MIVILYGLLIAHLNSYKEYYLKIFTTFSVAYLMKRLAKVAGQKEQSDLVGLGGYALTGSEFIKLVGAIKDSGKQIRLDSPENAEILGGLFGKSFDLIKEILNK